MLLLKIWLAWLISNFLGHNDSSNQQNINSYLFIDINAEQILIYDRQIWFLLI